MYACVFTCVYYACVCVCVCVCVFVCVVCVCVCVCTCVFVAIQGVDVITSLWDQEENLLLKMEEREEVEKKKVEEDLQYLPSPGHSYELS